MPGTRPILLTLVTILLLASDCQAQREVAGSAEIRLALRRLNMLGRVMMIAAHPDDENTSLLAWFARGQAADTAYLSLTRGEGGQNLIGPEQGSLFGLVRTQELLAARRIDGARQFFTRAIDFGFSKSADETLAKWGRERILADVVWNIRRFRPDVIILRFSGTPRDGHGQHQSSAILGKEAFQAAADPSRFPEQLHQVKPWHATRVLFNVFSWSREAQDAAEREPEKIAIDAGEFDPVLGHSYEEIAGMSRSAHRSQGMGAPEHKGPQKHYLLQVAGQKARESVFDGVDITWSRVLGAEEVSRLLREAATNLDDEKPEGIIPLLLQARASLATLSDPLAAEKLHQLGEAIALCAGLWMEGTASRPGVVPGQPVEVRALALNRSRYPLRLKNIRLEGPGGEKPFGPAEYGELPYNQPRRYSLTITLPPDQPYSHPYWLKEPASSGTYKIQDEALLGLPESPAVLAVRFRVEAGSQEIEYARPVVHRYVDSVLGERTRPLEVVPPVALAFASSAFLFPEATARQVDVQVKANIDNVEGHVRLDLPPGWRSEPPTQPFRIAASGEQTVVSFQVLPPSRPADDNVRAVASAGGMEISTGMEEIRYPHIPIQTAFPPAAARFVRADVHLKARRIGYVMGAGDEIPQALRQFGAEVVLLDDAALARGELSSFDAIVTGVRAHNVRPALVASHQRLMDYVERGGTLVVQYNVLEWRRREGAADPLARLGPYPLEVGRGRVSMEEAPVRFLHPDHPLLRAPNLISAEDFQGWVQERGLYFAAKWDPRYEALLECGDDGEPFQAGGLLYTPYGKGVYIFTAYSWFRQLPAGVPGAFRLFANLLSARKPHEPASQ